MGKIGQDIPHWWQEHFDAVDAKQTEAWLAGIADDAYVRFANMEPITSKTALRGFAEQFAQSYKSIRHVAGPFLIHGELAAGEATITFTLHNGRAVELVGATVMEYRDGLIRRLSVHVDFSPLYAAMAA